MADLTIAELTGVTADPAHEIPVHSGGGLTRKVTAASLVSLGGGGAPGGANTQLQFNDGGSFGGDAGLTFDKTNDILTIGGNANLVGEAANLLALRNGANAQALRIYNTFTDPSNWERFVARWTTNEINLLAEALGTGTRRNLNFGGESVYMYTQGSVRWGFSSTIMFPTSDVTNDIGTSGVRVKDIYASQLRMDSGNAILTGDAADILAQRRGTSGQTFRVYTTFTDSSNHRRLVVTGDFLGVGHPGIFAEAAGTGGAAALYIGTQSANSVTFRTSAANQWEIDFLGRLFPINTDNAQDLGLSTARIRDIYLGRTLVLTQGTLTDPVLGINHTVTWNDAADTFTAWKQNVTNTASAVASLLLDLQVNSATVVSVGKIGPIRVVTGSNLGAPYFVGSNFGSDRFYIRPSSDDANTTILAGFDSTSAMHVQASSGWGWVGANGGSGSLDLVLRRDAANILAQRNGTNAQQFRVYNTFADSSNYERVAMQWAANEAQVISEEAGSGTLRDLRIKAGATSILVGADASIVFGTSGGIWQLHASVGTLHPVGNNYDLGGHAIGSGSVRDFYMTRDLYVVAPNNLQQLRIRYLTELTTIAAAATTDTAIQIPADSFVLGVSVRVTVAIPTSTSFDIGVSGQATRYTPGAGAVSTAANSTGASPGNLSPVIYGTATAIRLTMNGGTPANNSGRVRVTIHYIDLVAPTS